jgi:hypothetical protein
MSTLARSAAAPADGAIEINDLTAHGTGGAP